MIQDKKSPCTPQIIHRCRYKVSLLTRTRHWAHIAAGSNAPGFGVHKRAQRCHRLYVGCCLGNGPWVSVQRISCMLLVQAQSGCSFPKPVYGTRHVRRLSEELCCMQYLPTQLSGSETVLWVFIGIGAVRICIDMTAKGYSLPSRNTLPHY